MSTPKLKSESGHLFTSQRTIGWQMGIHSYGWSPPTDVYETEAAFYIRVEIAGMRRSDFAIDIEDQGTGVKTEDVDRLFTPFFTTKKNGHGLGLYICYQMVNAHGGTIRYHRGKSGGSVFTVLLPM